jgi:hypothetical protein
MATVQLSTMPEVFAAGTTVVYTRTEHTFPADDGWANMLSLTGPSTNPQVAGVASGKSFVFTLTSTSTALLLPGPYQWREIATKGATSYAVADGLVEILPDLRQFNAGMGASWEARMLPLIEAALETLLTTGVQAYQIGSGNAVRSFTKTDVGQLMRIRDNLKSVIESQRRPGEFGIGVLGRFTGYEAEL